MIMIVLSKGTDQDCDGFRLEDMNSDVPIVNVLHGLVNVVKLM